MKSNTKVKGSNIATEIYINHLLPIPFDYNIIATVNKYKLVISQFHRVMYCYDIYIGSP